MGRPWMPTFYLDESESIVIRKSAKCGITEWGIVDIFARAERGLASIYVLPTEDVVGTFVKDRVNYTVENTPEYKRIRTKADADSVGLKHFWGSAVRFIGSNARVKFHEFTSDTLYIDEHDKCEQKNLAFAEDRLLASLDPRTRKFGNPTYRNVGIDKLFKESDAKEWKLKCDHCNHWQTPDFFVHVVRQVKKDKWELLDRRYEIGTEPRIFCRKCNKPLYRLSAGEWVARHRDRPISGYAINRIFGDFRHNQNVIEDLWIRFNKGLVNPIELENFFQSHLGLPYISSDVAVSVEMMGECVEKGWKGGFEHEKDGKPQTFIIGVDVGKVLNYVIAILEDDYTRRLVDIGTCSWAELDDLCEEYEFTVGVIDAKPELQKVEEFLNAHHEFYACDYRRSEKMDDFDINESLGEVKVDRTKSLDRSLAQWKLKKVLIFEGYRYIDEGEFVEQMTRSTRVLRETPSGKRYVWEGEPDHYRHADSYCDIARQIIEIGGGKIEFI